MSVSEWIERNPILAIIVILVLTIVAAAIAFVFARMLIKSLNDSAKWEEPLTTLMLILGTISVVALIGALFTNSESAYTIAATGVGAFAGALSSGAQKAIGERSPKKADTESASEPVLLGFPDLPDEVLWEDEDEVSETLADDDVDDEGEDADGR